MKETMLAAMEWLGILAAMVLMVGVIVGIPWAAYSFATYSRNWCREFGHARTGADGRCGRCRARMTDGGE